MKSVSRYLYHYLETHLQQDRTNFTFTPLSRTFLSSLFYKINIANIKW